MRACAAAWSHIAAIWLLGVAVIQCGAAPVEYQITEHRATLDLDGKTASKVSDTKLKPSRRLSITPSAPPPMAPAEAPLAPPETMEGSRMLWDVDLEFVEEEDDDGK